MKSTLCLGTVAVKYLAAHHSRAFSYGELFAALRTDENRPLPAGCALMQRLNEKIKELAKLGIIVTKTYTELPEDGCIRRVYYRMDRANAAKWQSFIALDAAKKRAAKRDAKSQVKAA